MRATTKSPNCNTRCVCVCVGECERFGSGNAKINRNKLQVDGSSAQVRRHVNENNVFIYAPTATSSPSQNREPYRECALDWKHLALGRRARDRPSAAAVAATNTTRSVRKQKCQVLIANWEMFVLMGYTASTSCTVQPGQSVAQTRRILDKVIKMLRLMQLAL